MKPAITRELARKYDLIFALAANTKLCASRLQEETGLPISTLKRYIASMRADFSMEIDFVRDTGKKGGAGSYLIKNWGILDKETFIVFWSKRNETIKKSSH